MDSLHMLSSKQRPPIVKWQMTAEIGRSGDNVCIAEETIKEGIFRKTHNCQKYSSQFPSPTFCVIKTVQMSLVIGPFVVCHKTKPDIYH